MSIAFTILCTRSPAYFLRKRGKDAGWKRGKGQIGGLSIVQRKVEAGDPLPEDDYEERVLAVFQADGRLDDDAFATWVSWSEALAEATRGAIFSHAADEFSYVWASDPRPFMREWTQARLAAGEIDAIVARVNRPETVRNTRAMEHDAIREIAFAAFHLALPELGPARQAPVDLVAPSDLMQLAPLVNVLFDHREYDREIQDVVLAIGKRPGMSDAVRVRVNLIEDRRQRELDERALVPATNAEIRSLFEGVAAKDPSCERRKIRFVLELRTELSARVLAAVVQGWDPAPEVAALVTGTLDPIGLTRAQLEQLEQLPDTGALARSLRVTARNWRDNAAKRTTAYAMKQYKYYEHYRDNESVGPVDRSMDMAMFRPLNDALFGQARNLPRMPEPIIVMICDRRFDDARAAYVAQFGEARADDAIRDAIEFFAPDVP